LVETKKYGSENLVFYATASKLTYNSCISKLQVAFKAKIINIVFQLFCAGVWFHKAELKTFRKQRIV
jgi:hypothetical protein